VIGRAAELRTVERFADAARTSPAALVVEGEPGIGKTTLWEAGIEAPRARGVRVLQARASSAEARLSFAGLTDLALLRAAPGGSVPEPRAIGVGLLGVLRSLERSEIANRAVELAEAVLDVVHRQARSARSQGPMLANGRAHLGRCQDCLDPLEVAAGRDVRECVDLHAVPPPAGPRLRPLRRDRIHISPVARHRDVRASRVGGRDGSEGRRGHGHPRRLV
jgi:hypothetical protein